MPKAPKIECPMCEGHGTIDGPAKTVEARARRKSEIAKTLKKEGYTVREIMALMGYKSTNSVSVLLNAK
jgi:hypothetical protein